MSRFYLFIFCLAMSSTLPSAAYAENDDSQQLALASSAADGMANNVSLRFLKQPNPSVTARLVRQLQSGNAAERTCAATDLGSLRLNRSELFTYLAFALRNDESKWVRRAAAKSLGKLGLAKAIAPLTEALKDSDHWVAHSAANALRLLNHSSF